MKNKTHLILVGGFLGAGKTTLLFETTKKLMKEGKKVGLVTNDQASELVDTSLLLNATLDVAEVSGSCFCCNFKGFIDSVKHVEERSDADILISEPVGSCTDLSATILQPLKEHYSDKLHLAPLTVLADPFKLESILDGETAGLHKSAAYIYRKQLEESDLIVITKTDLLEAAKIQFIKEKTKALFPQSKVMSISSKTGEGMDEWLDYVLKNISAGEKIVDVDYETYAEGEAFLGWLNASLTLSGKDIDWDEFAKTLLHEFGQQIKNSQLSVGHVKLIIRNNSNYLVGNITSNSGEAEIRGSAGISDQVQLIINARVGLSPEELDLLVQDALNEVTGDRILKQVDAWKCLSPGYPNPTYRYNYII